MNNTRNRRQFKNNNKKRNKNKNNRQNFATAGIDRNRALISAYGLVRQNQLNFLPPWIECPMRYSDVFNISIAGGLSSEYIYRANSLFDPDRTSTGHQPLGFDTMAQAYSHYRVDRLEWYIEMPSVTLSYGAGVCLVNGSTTIGSLGALMEYPSARLHSVGFNGAPPAIFTGHKMIPPFVGKSMLSYHTDDVTGALVNASPVEVIDLHIVVNNPNPLTSIVVQLNINLKYRAVFYDPVTPSQSFDHSLHQNRLEQLKNNNILQRPLDEARSNRGPTSKNREEYSHKGGLRSSDCNRDSSTIDGPIKYV